MGIWVEYFKRVRGWLDEGRPEVTHTLERIIEETGTTDKSVHGAIRRGGGSSPRARKPTKRPSSRGLP